MRACATCGHQFQPGDRVCANCGRARHDGAGASPAAPFAPGAGAGLGLTGTGSGRECVTCGQRFQPGDRVCSRCGASRHAELAAAPFVASPAVRTTSPPAHRASPTPAGSTPPRIAPKSAESDNFGAILKGVGEQPSEPVDGQPVWESFAASAHVSDQSLSSRGRLVWLLVAAAVIVGAIVAGSIAISHRSKPAATIWFSGVPQPIAGGIHDAPQLRWRFPLPGDSPELSSVIQDDHRVYVAVVSGTSSTVVALDRRTGKQLWSQTDTGQRPALQVVGARVVVSTTNASDEGAATPLVLDALTGKRAWTVNGQWAFTLGSDRPMIIGRKQTLAIVDPMSGADRWTTALNIGVAFDESVFLERTCSAIRARDWWTGRELWKTDLTNGGCADHSMSPMTAVAGSVVIVVDNDQLIGFDRLDGHRLWSGPLPSPVDTLRAVNDELVIGGDGSSGFAINPATGDILVDNLQSGDDTDLLAIRNGATTTLVARDFDSIYLVDPKTLAKTGDGRPADSVDQMQGLGLPFALVADTTYSLRPDLGNTDLEAYDLATGKRRWSVPARQAKSIVSVGRTIVVADRTDLFAFG